MITDVRILDDQDSVHYVTHDEEDGTWQFHPYGGPATMQNATVISLAHMLKIEPRLAELADLPMGWHAWRDSRSAPWARARRQVSDGPTSKA